MLLAKLKELPLSEKDEKTVSTYKGAALGGAVRNNHKTVAEDFIEKIGDGISPAAKGKALISSVKSNYPDITKMLLEKCGNEISSKNMDEAKAFATKYGYEEIEKIFNNYFDEHGEVSHSASDSDLADISPPEDTEHTTESSKADVVGDFKHIVDEF